MTLGREAELSSTMHQSSLILTGACGLIPHEADTHEQLNKKFIELAKEREALIDILRAGGASMKTGVLCSRLA